MTKKRSEFFEAKNFGLLLGLLVAVLLFLVGLSTTMLGRLELMFLDGRFLLRDVFGVERLQEGVTIERRNPKISPDILIVGVDFNTLQRFGQWPFPRYRHADLVTGFSRIRNQNERERSVFLDFFFIEPADPAVYDALLLRGMRENGRVFLETVLEPNPPPAGREEELFERHEVLFESAGRLTDVTGEWTKLRINLGLQPPLQPYGRAAAGYGHANFNPFYDKVFRTQPLVAASSQLLATIPLADLTPEFEVDADRYQKLVWFDTEGIPHVVDHPLTDSVLRNLRADMEADAPLRVVDSDGDGTADSEFYVVRLYEDEFVPSITLALAADYFNKSLSDLEVVIGEHIRIPEPQKFDSESGEWGPYTITTKLPEVDAEGNITSPAETRTLSEIVVPIDEYGEMVINYMGGASSASQSGRQTFPVRSYSGYAASTPGPDPSRWPRTRAVANKVIMVGAFAPGMADDEKLTPFGLMYGVEMHANALNTILMDNFLEAIPPYADALILLVMSLIVAFLTARAPTGWSLAASFLLIIALFSVAWYLFEAQNLIMNFSTPALAVVLTLITVVAYRVITEERDKRRIRETFGKYVSPSVVDQILESPPELGGVDREMTVFFSDIRGFTTLSETMTPQELVNHLNVYLTSMTDIILDYQGTLDKYVGDEIMCFWGAPLPQDDHAMLACKCALRQMEALAELNKDWPEERRIDIGIGVNSGVMTVGNMGSEGRMNYTLTGDNVNTGARLEGTNKAYMTNVIISEYTYGLVQDRVVARELDTIRVKGKNRPLVIYELIDVPEGLDPPEPRNARTDGRRRSKQEHVAAE
jgi:adenylate cyclase